jgi:hypothetical protein
MMMFGEGLLEYLARRRWEVETGGITVLVDGQPAPLPTSRGDERAALQSTYSAIRDGLRLDGDSFKFADGVPRAVSNADMMAAIVAAFRHVQGAFNAEGAVRAQIEAGTLHTTPQVEQAFTAALAA